MIKRINWFTRPFLKLYWHYVCFVAGFKLGLDGVEQTKNALMNYVRKEFNDRGLCMNCFHDELFFGIKSNHVSLE